MSRRVKLAVIGLLTIGVSALTAAAIVGGGSSTDISVTSNDAVEALIPPRETEVLQQQQVGIDLAAEYRLVSLRISPTGSTSGGIEVISETTVVDGLNQVLFFPGEGQSIVALAPDTNCVVATYVEIARPDDPESIDWCFEVS